MTLRPDLKIIADLINEDARVLDLGCGEGDLLAYLQSNKNVNGYGLDVDADNICTCLGKGVNVIEQDLDEGLANFADDSFNMVVMTETLQSVQRPRPVTGGNAAHRRRMHRDISQLRSLALPPAAGSVRPHASGETHPPQLVRHTKYSLVHVCRLRTSLRRPGIAHHSTPGGGSQSSRTPLGQSTTQSAGAGGLLSPGPGRLSPCEPVAPWP